MKRVLFIGESWLVHVQETKGFDVFTYDFYEEAVGFIQKALTSDGTNEFVHSPSHRLEMDFPTTLEDLQKFDVVMISDCGANTFNLPMNTFTRLQRSVNKLELLKEFVEKGGALVMIGGYLTFQGIQARGCWKNTPVEEILPVDLQIGDDRVEKCQGVVPVTVQADHPVLAGVPAQWPAVLGYNRLSAKKDAVVVAEIEGNPFIALREVGEGRTCAYATDCAPHWSPDEFCNWEGYTRLWLNLVNWLTKK